MSATSLRGALERVGIENLDVAPRNDVALLKKPICTAPKNKWYINSYKDIERTYQYLFEWVQAAAIAGAKQVFGVGGGTVYQGCYFHLRQAIWKKIKNVSK